MINWLFEHWAILLFVLFTFLVIWFFIRISYILGGKCAKCGSKMVTIFPIFDEDAPPKYCMRCGHHETIYYRELDAILETHDQFMEYLELIGINLCEVDGGAVRDRIQKALENGTICDLAQEVGCSVQSLIRYSNDLEHEGGAQARMDISNLFCW